ncbi:MAG: glycosyltransferase [Candidatus Rokubacteria bacterium]|nr:glycosyltransferase [Candidatus Rokubacteria bacterium]
MTGDVRVLHVITRLTLGGSSENTVLSMVALEQAGYRADLAVGLVESEAATVAETQRRGCRIIDVPALRREVVPSRDFRALAALTRLMRRARPAIVHTHTSKAGFIGRLAARLARVPAVIHQPHGHIFYGYYDPGRTRIFVALERLAARWCDRIVTLTERGTEEHLALRIGRREQYVAVPSGVPTDAIRAAAPPRGPARRALGLAADAFVVIGVGRLVSVKGFDILVAALPRLRAAVPAARVLLVGDGPERAALTAQAERLGVADALQFAGAHDDVTPFLAAADVLGAPSRNEGMGRVLIEAMALGVPVVGAAVGGIPSVIGDGAGGRLVPADDPVAFARALSDLGEDACLRAKLGEAARARAEAFSTTVAARRMRDVYDGLAREKGLR